MRHVLLSLCSVVISEKKRYPTFVYGYQSIYAQDLPLYVSADSILYADRDQPPLPGDGFVTEGNEASRGNAQERGVTWDETEDGIVEISPRSFVTRDLALLRYMQRKGYAIPADLETFYRDDVGWIRVDHCHVFA